MKESDYLMYILITDRKNNLVWEWRRGQGNIILGLKVLQEVIEYKLGITIPTTMFSLNGHGKKIVERDTKNVVMVQPGIGLVIQPDSVDLSTVINRIRESGGIRVDGATSDESAQT
jgi:hypothetical protein